MRGITPKNVLEFAILALNRQEKPCLPYLVFPSHPSVRMRIVRSHGCGTRD